MSATANTMPVGAALALAIGALLVFGPWIAGAVWLWLLIVGRW